MQQEITMSQLVGMIVRIEDVNKLEELSQLWRQPLPLSYQRRAVGIHATLSIRQQL